MTGDKNVIVVLQAAQQSEAHLNAQYRQDWRWVKFMGLCKTAKCIHQLGSDAHHWVKAVTDRLLFLGGTVGYEMDPVVEPTTITSMFEQQLAMEMAIVKPYEENIQVCVKAYDDASRNLFEHLVLWHTAGNKKYKGHTAWLEQQLRLIKSIGEDEYIAEKM